MGRLTRRSGDELRQETERLAMDEDVCAFSRISRQVAGCDNATDGLGQRACKSEHLACT